MKGNYQNRENGIIWEADVIGRKERCLCKTRRDIAGACGFGSKELDEVNPPPISDAGLTEDQES